MGSGTFLPDYRGDFSHQWPDRRETPRPSVDQVAGESLPRGAGLGRVPPVEPSPGGPVGGPDSRDTVADRIARLLGIEDTERYNPERDETALKLIEATRLVREGNARIYSLIETQMYPRKLPKDV